MQERLAIPAWQTPTRTLEDWVNALKISENPGEVLVDRESTTVAWIELPALRIRGYALSEGPGLSAINFEFHASDMSPGLQVIQSVADSLGWELHDEDDEDDDSEG